MLGACTPHPVGPARTYEKYEGKAVTTAEGALSVVETVRQLADVAGRGNAFGPYTSVAASDQEESITRLQDTFGSIQPPNGKAVGVRDDLDGLLSQAVDGVAAVRIAARQGRLDDLPHSAGPLTDVAAGLRAFLEAHKG
jgi:hypothetical protein